MLRLLLVALLLLTACSSPEPATTVEPAKNPPPAEAPTPASTKSSGSMTDGVKVEKPRWTDEQGNAVESPTPRKVKRWNGLVTGNWKEPLPNVAPDQRCVVLHTKVGSPAREAGLREMDVILSSAGVPVKSYKDYIAGAKTVEVGESLELEVMRGTDKLTVQVGMLEKPVNMLAHQKAAFPGSASYDFELPMLRPKDGVAKSADQGDRLQVLYFWATWCGPCRRTSPIVSKLHDELGDQVRVLGVSSEEADVIAAYVEKNPQYTYPVVHDEERGLKRWFEVKKLPTIVLVGRDGKVIDWDISVSGVNRLVAKARSLAAEQ